MDRSGGLFFGDEFTHEIYELSPNGTNWTFSYVTDLIYEPAAIAVDQAGNLYVVDPAAGAVFEIKPGFPEWQVSTIAGGVSSGSRDGIGTNAQFRGASPGWRWTQKPMFM